jgi:C4-dicarboxylate-specific signal transduction histidine kinase
MNTFTLPQARESIHSAARAVSVRAALPFVGTYNGELATFLSITLIIIFVLHLMRREIMASRTHTEHTHTELKDERDTLEKRVAERTHELIVAETERLQALERTARFGELSRGLFHDLMSPLTSLSLYLEKLGTAYVEPNEGREIIGKVVGISKRMTAFMGHVRHTMGDVNLSTTARADLKEELGIIRDVLGYKARTAGVTLTIGACPNICIPIHSVRLHQVLVNIVANGIDACIEDQSHMIDKEYTVAVSAIPSPDIVTLFIEDNGCGMNEEQLKTLFTRPSSTKSGGLGMGLKTVKDILENELHGSIQVESTPKNGTTFTLKFPYTVNR